MDRYNLRTTSLNTSQLTSELAKHGAQTFGTHQRKQQRLQRFIDAKDAGVARKELQREAVRAVILSRTGRQGRTATVPEVRRSSRIRALLNEYLGY
jgi:hypothetical protein